jgi:hypothetical protein
MFCHPEFANEIQESFLSEEAELFLRLLLW